MSIPTPHINAKKEDIAKTVLMPGDPLRAKLIADSFLENAVLVNNVRGVQGHTGTWRGVPVTVMASGMGIPAIGIYSWELFNFYDVENIIRVGSAGALRDDLGGSFAPIADFELLTQAVAAAKERGVDMKVGNLLSNDNFYSAPGCGTLDAWKRMGVMAVEMEAAGLYVNAAAAGRRALCICTISDHIYRPEALSAEQRQSSFSQMIEIALDTAVRMAKR